MIRFWHCLFLLFFTFIVSACSKTNSSETNLLVSSDTSVLRKHIASLIYSQGYRNYLDTLVLNNAADYITNEFLKITDHVSEQKFESDGRIYKNIICSLGPENAERIIIGAHYDVCGNQPGADDNASGVAGLLEIARLLQTQKLKYRVDLIAYTLEEPPYFRSNKMGSYVHARYLSENHIPVKGMICLEMIGYFNDSDHSQDYPSGIMKWFYGGKGNYILIVQKFGNGKFGRQFNRNLRKLTLVKTRFIRSPKILPGVDFSDHRNYWKFGYNAVMVTNTAFYRNKNYHTLEDKIEFLDFKRMSGVVDEVFLSVINIK